MSNRTSKPPEMARVRSIRCKSSFIKLKIRSNQTAKGGTKASGMRINQAGKIPLDNKNARATSKNNDAIPVFVSIAFRSLSFWLSFFIVIRQTLYQALFFYLFDQLVYHQCLSPELIPVYRMREF